MRKLYHILALVLISVMLAGCAGNPYKEGMTSLEEGNYKEAAESFQQAVEKDKNTADAYRGLGIALWEQEDYEGACDAFGKALKEGTEKNGTLYNFLGNCELKLGNPKKALSYYEKGLKDKECSKALVQQMEYNIIVSYEGMEEWEQAKEALSKYTETYPDDETAQKELQFLETR